jgi:hypothetical protein
MAYVAVRNARLGKRALEEEREVVIVLNEERMTITVPHGSPLNDPSRGGTPILHRRSGPDR